MTGKGIVTQESMVQFDRVLPGPIERVWSFLAESEHIAAWFGDPSKHYSIESRAGGAIDLADGHIRGVVTQWQPPRKLTYTWNVFGEGETESQFPESYLSFELRSAGNDVALTLTHRPVLADFESRTMVGWHTFLEMLETLLKGQQPESRATVMERSRVLYGVAPFKTS